MKINTCIVKSVLFNIYSLQENVMNFKRYNVQNFTVSNL